MAHRILVTGSTGQLGGAILAALSGGIHSAEGSSRTGSAGTRLIDFDLPSTVKFDGVDTLVLVSAGEAEDDVVIARHETAIAAAERDGVSHVIYSSLTASGDHLGFALAHRWTEHRLQRSTLNWTILRNGLYAELFGALLTWSNDRLDSAFGGGALAAVARLDLADAAAVVAAAPAQHAGRIYELVGPPITATDVAQALDVDVDTVALETRRSELMGAGLKPFQPDMQMSIYSSVRHGVMGSTSPDLQMLLGRPLRDAVTIAASVAAATRPASRGEARP